MSETGFTLSGLSLPEREDPLGVWDVEPASVSFAAGEQEPEVPTWHVALPSSSKAAQAHLAARAKALDLSRRDLTHAERELMRFDPSGAVAFDVGDPLSEQQRALRTQVEALQTPVAFGVKPPQWIADSEAYRQWNEFVARVRQMVSDYARIETTSGGRFVGRTEVGWTGDFGTTWAGELTQASMAEHREAVHLALSSRIALARLVSVVATGAAGLAVKASIPGGQVLLLPATWRFVRDVLKELRASWPDIEHLI
jgi:hypothetical protein